jgi:hypothetical protein
MYDNGRRYLLPEVTDGEFMDLMEGMVFYMNKKFVQPHIHGISNRFWFDNDYYECIDRIQQLCKKLIEQKTERKIDV